jgi:tetratricopeptide (TPR) repeat protein
VTPRGRVVALTAAAAVVSATVVVGVVAAQTDRPAPMPAEQTAPRGGRPPLVLELGVRDDAEARELRRADELYESGQVAEAGTVFGRHSSLEARVGRAFVAWPDVTVDRLNALAGLHPRSPVVQLNLGIALYWARKAGAEDAWKAVVEAAPDTPYAVAAGNLLYPGFARDLPRFVPGESLPANLGARSPALQLAELERRARHGDRLATLYYGVALQRLGHQLSAARVLGAYAKAHPGDVEAQVAAAVARFDKAKPVEAFSRLGPLTRRFPDAATVRFHLGLLLLWSGEVKEASRQLRLALRAEPGSAVGREAARYLRAVGGTTG